MADLRLNADDYARTDAGDGRQLGHICNPAEGQQRLLAALLRIEDLLSGGAPAVPLDVATMEPDPTLGEILAAIERQNALLAELVEQGREPAVRRGRPPKTPAEG